MSETEYSAGPPNPSIRSGLASSSPTWSAGSRSSPTWWPSARPRERTDRRDRDFCGRPTDTRKEGLDGREEDIPTRRH